MKAVTTKMEKETKDLKILLLDQGRQSLPFLKALTRAGHQVFIACNTRICEGFFSRYPAKRLLWPSYVKDPEGFKKTLVAFLKEEEIDITLSVSDFSAELLSRHRDEISQYTKLTVPDYAKFSKVTDKLKLMTYCMENDIPCPVTYALDKDTDHEVLKRFIYPVIVKPRKGIGALGVQKFPDPRSVKQKLEDHAEKYGSLLIQEFIPQEGGMQYQAQAFLDHESNMKVCMVIEKPRFFPVTGGTSTANVTVKNPEIVATCKTLLEGIGWVGPADVDLILDPRDNVAKVLEINPRVTAGIKIGFAAGINYADLHLKFAMGEPIPQIDSYQVGVYSRNMFMEVLWYLYATRAMKQSTKPSFFRIFGKNVVDQTISLDDPLAGVGFFLNMVRKYMDISYLREKIGR